MFIEAAENGWQKFNELFRDKGTLWGSFRSIIFENESAYIEFTCGLLQSTVDNNGNWQAKDCHQVQAILHDPKVLRLTLDYERGGISDPGYIEFDKQHFCITSIDSVGFDIALSGSKMAINKISRIDKIS